LHAAEVKKLSKILRSDHATLEDIYRHYDALAELDDFEIPEAVQVRYEARIAEIEKKQKVKKLVTMGGVAVAVILLLIVAANIIF